MNIDKKIELNMALSKPLPQQVEVEAVVLGSLMVDSSTCDLVIPQLTERDFYAANHKTVFSAIKSLYASKAPIDILSVTNHLRDKRELEKAGGPFGVTTLTNRVGSTANAEYHVKILQEKKILREIIISDNDSTQAAYNDIDPLELLEKKQTFLNGLIGDSVHQNGKDANDLFDEAIQYLNDYRDNEGANGTPIGLRRLEKIVKNWGNQELILVAARPGMGKTAFTKTIMQDCRKAGKVCVFFSLEMSRVSLMMRLILDELGVKLNSEEYTLERLKELDFALFCNVVDKIQEMKAEYTGQNFLELLHIDDTPAIDIVTFRAKLARIAAKMKAKREDGFEPEIGAVVVDYLQLMRGNGKNYNRQNEIAEISRGLKAAAKEFNVPIIALSQLSRAVESRGGDRRPVLSDIRESGQIEQDCDKIIFLWRCGYYVNADVFAAESEYIIKDKTLHQHSDLNTDSFGVIQMSEAMHVMEAIVAKHRNGGTGTAYLKFEGSKTRVSDFGQSTVIWEKGERAGGESLSFEEINKDRNTDEILPF